ncbi:saccharopine dehydrogenase family protein [Wenjunlia tyrosinilytica]|uniref:Saccharopine dehydrogenase n=1 Tax=Wenjunlia tyrosinilytica TaxID=1544741 RepID=A0A918DXS0_9ACTN|nr:saccharopine dehydrogenase NADP-binding domain-containing protein [Wenjunlia tyrosinilytica]GGO87646.1 saccharopine dehydrogenase [Wenjunlia tyrosinilytica]
MPKEREDRPHDLVLFGATGFTGELTAEYLARNAPPGCRWALAGRSVAKLEALRERLARLNPDCAELPLLRADVTDEESVRAVARQARVVATTVGPYVRYGEPLVAACAEAGTDYVDLCGEPEFVDTMYPRHHARAVESGARLVHACGFDSVPYDLGVLYTVGLLPQGVPVRVRGFVRAGGTFSGGTFHSAVGVMSRRRQAERAAVERRRVEPTPRGRRARAERGRPHRAHALGMWAVPLPTLDPLIVKRSAAALEQYGPDFVYRHFAAVRHLPMAVGGVAGVGAVFALAKVPPLRRWLLNRRKPGQGPSAERRDRAWFTVRFVAEAGGRQVVTEVSGGDPGYGETAKMLAQSALCLAFDELPDTAGQVTTAVAMGEALIGRLSGAGIVFRVVR